MIHGEETGKESRQEAKEEVTGFYGHLKCKFQAACSAGCLFYRPLLGGKARQDPAANIRPSALGLRAQSRYGRLNRLLDVQALLTVFVSLSGPKESF